MSSQTTKIHLTINKEVREVTVTPEENLRDVLRRLSYFSVKHGCEDGTCGTCTVLIDGKAIHSCRYLAVNAVGKEIITVEGISENGELHPLQRTFMESGAIQCGFCTPGQILTAKALLDTNPNPSEDEIRQAMNSVICRCTGYVRPMDAILRAAAELRGEKPDPVQPIELTLPADSAKAELPEAFYRRGDSRAPLPPLIYSPEGYPQTHEVGKAEVKLDAEKLARGKAVFTDDLHMEGMLYGALLTSPHAHANIKKIDASRARALPGVRVVLTYQDLPRVKYASGGQSYPQLQPYDQVSLDNKVKDLNDYLAENELSWPQIFEEGGMDSPPANQLGVLTVPAMILVNQDGQVVNRAISPNDIEAEVKKLLR